MTTFFLFKRWFGLQGRVTRKEYICIGVSLILIKYTVEALVLGYVTGKFYSPLDFLNPFLATRQQFTANAPLWLGFAWVMWTLPFLWIAVTMSVRRAIDANASPWAGMLVLIPIINIFFLIYLSIIPTGYADREYTSVVKGEKASSASQEWLSTDVFDEEHVRSVLGVHAAMVGIAVGFVYMFSVVVIGIYVFKSYGAAMFFGTPLIAGAATAYTYNRWCARSLGSTIGLSIVSGGCFAIGLLLFGLEGMVCIAMAAPIVFPLGILGAIVGRAIANAHKIACQRKDKGLLGCLVMLPILAGLEPYVAPHSEFIVMSSVEIDAPPELVWKCVVNFPEISEKPEWFFRAGIASPLRARIEGAGVGAIRYCEFSTGAFVEPITVWDEPHHLAFDVTEQPHPMTELSPYRHIHPPHLDDSFRSIRGEFLLVPTPGGGTRLEGRTWYQLDIYPHAYWTLWTDWIVHRIHLRVLRHIKELAEE